jgi:hypothetical protein
MQSRIAGCRGFSTVKRAPFATNGYRDNTARHTTAEANTNVNAV